jgi:hypothetical protein
MRFDYARKGRELARMRKIGYSTELVDLIDKMIEESEMRRIDLESVGMVVDRVDRIGNLDDGLSRAASRSRHSLRDEDFTKENFISVQDDIQIGGSG